MIRTGRLLLRPWRDDDAEPWAAMGRDPEVMEHFPALLDRAQSDAAMARIRAHHERNGFGVWAVEVVGGARFIGFIGLARPVWRPDVVEVGWRLARPHWSHGYATEGARAALAWGWENLPIDEIVAFVVPANGRSQAVMQRLGMALDPAADFDHPTMPEGHPLRPHWLYRIARPAP